MQGYALAYGRNAMRDLINWLFGITPKATAATPHGFALCVGLNSVDPRMYEGWSGPLRACENDARHMSRMLEDKGFETTVLLTANATRRNVTTEIKALAMLARPGDIVVVTNSSHGSQVPDTDGTETDGMDETICLYDGQLLDDELAELWARFRAGVRIVFVSDSCHSGTMARLFGQAAVMSQPGSKAVPVEVAGAVAAAHRGMYKAIQDAVVKQPIVASVLALGACQDNQTAMDGAVNGAFTGALLRALSDYPRDCLGATIKRVRQALPPSQTPKYVYTGVRDNGFEKSTSFSI